MDYDEVNEESVDLKDILLFDTEPQDGKLVVCGEYVPSFLPTIPDGANFPPTNVVHEEAKFPSILPDEARDPLEGSIPSTRRQRRMMGLEIMAPPHEMIQAVDPSNIKQEDPEDITCDETMYLETSHNFQETSLLNQVRVEDEKARRLTLISSLEVERAKKAAETANRLEEERTKKAINALNKLKQNKTKSTLRAKQKKTTIAAKRQGKGKPKKATSAVNRLEKEKPKKAAGTVKRIEQEKPKKVSTAVKRLEKGKKANHIADKDSSPAPKPPRTNKKIVCCICNVETKNLKYHMKHRHNKDSDECGVFSLMCCSLQFHDFSAYSEHKLQEHGVDELTCLLCSNLAFPSASSVEKHYLVFHCNPQPDSYKCHDCRNLFGVCSAFFDHRKNCNEAAVVCKDIMESIFESVFEPNSRSKNNTAPPNDEAGRSSSSGQVLYELVCCDQVFTNFIKFNVHKFVAHQIEHLVCGLCFCEKGTTNALYRHYLQAHFTENEVCLNYKNVEADDEAPVANENDEASDEFPSDVDEECEAEHEGEWSTGTQPIEENDLTNNEVRNMCYVCNVSFKNKKALSGHFKTHEFNKFPCDICGSSFTKNKALKNHKLYAHSTNPFKVTCEVCSREFCSTSSLNKHVKQVHLREGKDVHLQCVYCFKEFSNNRSLEKHINVFHTQRRKFICDHCGRIFYDRNLIISHMTHNHLPAQKISCELCGHVVTNKVALARHKNAVHLGLLFPCGICGKMFLSRTKVEEHQICHKDEKPFVCRTCGKGFKRDANLQQHQYTHREDKLHSCEVCGKKFRLSTHVKQHMAVHGMTNDFKCTICDLTFSRKGALNRHIATHSV